VHRATGGKGLESVVEVAEVEPDRLLALRMLRCLLERQLRRDCEELKRQLEEVASG
jgi:hypothetical protein